MFVELEVYDIVLYKVYFTVKLVQFGTKQK